MFDLDEDFPAEDPDKNCGFIDSTAQRNSIKNSLLNMIDDEPSETSEFNVVGAAKEGCATVEDPGQKEMIDNIMSAIQNIDLQS
jgi:hypothetical protein